MFPPSSRTGLGVLQLLQHEIVAYLLVGRLVFHAADCEVHGGKGALLLGLVEQGHRLGHLLGFELFLGFCHRIVDVAKDGVDQPLARCHRHRPARQRGGEQKLVKNLFHHNSLSFNGCYLLLPVYFVVIVTYRPREW